MKILDLSHPDTATPHSLPHLVVATDSATVDHNKPLFLPETSSTWKADLLIGYRVSRLGKSIPARFALRHIDAMTLIIHFYGDNPGLSDAWLSAIDYSYAIGQWTDIAPNIPIHISSPIEFSGHAPDTSLLQSATQLLSRYFTLKNGDIIIPSSPLASFIATPGMRVDASIDNLPNLTFNIK